MVLHNEGLLRLIIILKNGAFLNFESLGGLLNGLVPVTLDRFLHARHVVHQFVFQAYILAEAVINIRKGADRNRRSLSSLGFRRIFILGSFNRLFAFL